MAKNSKSTTDDTRTAPIDIAGQDALGFAAAFSGLYHLFGARVESWDVTSDGLVAHNVTFDATYDPEVIVRDINLKPRRAQLFPAILSIVNPEIEPPHFDADDPTDITTYMVNFWKGSMGKDSSRVPEYVRIAASKYKERVGTKVRKGPKVKSINLKNVRDLNPETLRNANLTSEDIQYLIDTATQAQALLVSTESAPADAEVVNA